MPQRKILPENKTRRQVGNTQTQLLHINLMSQTTLAFGKASNKMKALINEYDEVGKPTNSGEPGAEELEDDNVVESSSSSPKKIVKKQTTTHKSTINHFSQNQNQHLLLKSPPISSSPPQKKSVISSSPPAKKSPPAKSSLPQQKSSPPSKNSPKKNSNSSPNSQQTKNSPQKTTISPQKKETAKSSTLQPVSDAKPSSPTNFSPRKVSPRVNIEHHVWAWTNILRTKPHLFIDVLEEKKKFFKNNIYTIPGKTPIKTVEGIPVIDETIEFLKQQHAVQPLKYSVGLSLAARDHCKDKGPKGELGHLGTNGSTVSERVSKYGIFKKSCGENISYGCSEPQGIVLQLLVDDGVLDRGHRLALFNPDFDTLGAGFGPHSKFRQMSVMDFACGYADNEKIVDRIPFVSDGIFDGKVVASVGENGKKVEKIILNDTKDIIWFPVPQEVLEGAIQTQQQMPEEGFELFKQGVELDIKILSPFAIEESKPCNFVFTFGNSKSKANKTSISKIEKKKLNLINNDAWFDVFETKMKVENEEITLYHAHLSCVSKGFVGITFDKFFLVRFQI